MATRIVLTAGLLGGGLIPTYFALWAPELPLAWDFRAYLHAVDLFLSGEPFVGVSPPVGNGEFVYPPVIVGMFLPYAVFPDVVSAFVVQLLIMAGFCLGTGWIIVSVIERHSGPVQHLDKLLIYLFCLASTYPVIVLGQGQVDPLLLFVLSLAFLVEERGRGFLAGVLFAIPAIVKLFPALFGVWLVRKRSWLAVKSAVATGSAAVALSVLAFGLDRNLNYAWFILTDRSRIEDLGTTLSPNFSALTLSRPLSVVVPNVDPRFYPAIALTLVAPVLVVLWQRMETVESRLLAYLGTLGGVLLLSPASNIHHVIFLYFPLVPLLFLLDHEPTRTLLHVGTLVMLFPVQPMQVETVLGMAPLPLLIETVLADAVREVLTTGTMTLWGLLIVLAGCLSFTLWAQPESTSVHLTTDDD
ncbi:glycosyltransferase family 87 protein [Halorientalis salina]|uniref:glycosyltransferase family 87 protein n=1 Tax=Halorientalis salina TaxID=2932266 RepID=UPI00145EEF2A|nr:glycosyltransferase family 87 protein [Halorientalis salina]